MINKIYYYTIFSLIVLLTACANPKPPTGGPEDFKTPVLKKSIPLNNNTNFHGQIIRLEFDEYIDASKLRENIIISPLIEGKFDIVVKKKTVELKFREPFKDNTTYNINFSESIKDVTKGNLIKNLNLAFSTGPIIDSLSISGQVYDFITSAPLKDISIQLYSTKDTNNIKNSKPLYFSKSDLAGNFAIQNIKEGSYDVYALQDINTNFKYDNQKEAIAYVYDVNIEKKENKIKLGLTKSDTKAPEIVSRKAENDYYTISFNEGLKNYDFKSNNKKVLSSITENRKSIKIFNSLTSKDSITVNYLLTDSSNNTVTDSIKILFEELKSKKQKNNFYASIPTNKLQIIKNEDINIVFNKPIKSSDYSKIQIKKDTSIQKTEQNIFQLDSNQLSILLTNTYKFKDSLVIKLEKGAFLSINEDTSSATKFKITYKKEEDFGVIAGTVLCKEPTYIVQLIDSKGKIIDTKINMTKFYYSYLEPGNYILKLIVDTNNNGQWDPTDIYKNTPPEPIYYYKEKINLRANWELLDLKFEVK